MPLRRRLTIAAALAVAVAVALAAVAAYLAVAGELRSQVDQALQEQLTVRGGPPPGQRFDPGFRPLPARRGGPTPYIQAVDPSGNVVALVGTEEVALPVSAGARRVAAGAPCAFPADAPVRGSHVRGLAATPDGRRAVPLGRPLA